MSWVLEADLKNYFGSLSHDWLLRFVELRVGDQRLISLIRRWLKAGVLEDGELHPNEEGTPQGGSISVLLSNLYLHYVLDLWFERVVKPRLQGEAHLVRYIDDFVLCFQNRQDALRVQDALCKRLARFNLKLEPTKTKLVAFGRFAQTNARSRGAQRPDTIYFLGFTLYCTQNQKGNFRVGMRTEKSRFRRSLARLRELMRMQRHLPIPDEAAEPQQGDTRSLCLLRHCRELPSSATGISDRGALLAQNAVQPEPQRPHHMGCVPPDQGTALQLCDRSCSFLTRSYSLSLCCEPTSEERSAGNLHATFCGSRGRATASGDPVGGTARCPPIPISGTTRTSSNFRSSAAMRGRADIQLCLIRAPRSIGTTPCSKSRSSWGPGNAPTTPPGCPSGGHWLIKLSWGRPTLAPGCTNAPAGRKIKLIGSLWGWPLNGGMVLGCDHRLVPD